MSRLAREIQLAAKKFMTSYNVNDADAAMSLRSVSAVGKAQRLNRADL